MFCRKRELTSACVVTVAMGLAGCTTSMKDGWFDDPKATVVPGVVHNLPVTDIKIKATYSLGAKCVVTLDAVAVATVASADDSVLLAVDEEGLDGWTKSIKTASVNVGENGVLSSVNYAASDKTAEILVQAAKVAVLAPTLVPLTAQLSTRETGSFCPGQAVLAALAARQADLEVKTQALAARRTAYEADLTNDAAKKAYDAALGAFELAKKNLDEAKAAATVTDEYVCRPRKQGDAVTCDTVQDQQRPFRKWTGMLKGGLAVDIIDTAKFVTRVRPTDNAAGLYYAIPRPVAIRVSPIDGVMGTPFAARVELAQAGPLGRLQVSNGGFQSNSTAVDFHPNGRVKTFVYTSDQARAEALLSGVASAMKGRTEAATEELDRQTKFLEAEKKRRNAERALE